MARDVVLSLTAEGWNKWGDRFVNRQPLQRIQHPIGPSPKVEQAKLAILGAIGAAGAGGRVIINVGHGGTKPGALATEGYFELAPGGTMRIGGRNVQDLFVDVFYDVNFTGPPAMSDMDHDLKNNPTSSRLSRWAVYEEISKAFKAARLREVALLTCQVGNATEFLRKVANDWGTVIRGYRQRVGLTEDVVTVGSKVTRHFYMHLENNPPPIGRSAAALIIMEEEIPFSPNDTFLVGPP